MSRLAFARVLAFGTFLSLLTGQPTKEQRMEDWTWKDTSGKTRTFYELYDIVQKHEKWIRSDGKAGTRAELSGSKLTGAHLESDDLSRADLSSADLRGARLGYSNLQHADLHDADLRGADLNGVNISDARLDGAHLDGAHLDDTDLTSVFLQDEHLSGAHLDRADLSGADLRGADLRDAHLRDTKLLDAFLYLADLGHAIFEPSSAPDLRGVAGARNLELLTYEYNPDALFQLRKQFYDAGFSEQARKITYALKRRETELSWRGCKIRVLPKNEVRAILWSSDSNLANCGSFVLNKVFFDWTCQYGMSPGRPLTLGVVLWFLCSVLYFTCIHAPGETALYRVYSQGIETDPSAHRRVERISAGDISQTRGLRRFLQYFRREWLVLRVAMFFSLMSAFNIGFGDFNFGRWLRLLTRAEFDIKAVGWARVVAGWQSLISLFMLALWVLTYFGRPFG